MNQLKYEIRMLSDWHIGSGLDSATNADSLVKKDDQGHPYIPGKTIKGLIKDAFQDMVDVGQASEEALVRIFGKPEKDKEADEVEQQTSHSGNTFFANAKLPGLEACEIKKNNLSSFLYRNIASTAIDSRGVAKGKSLRVIEVTTPVVLEGYISPFDGGDLTSDNIDSNFSEADYKLLENAIKLVRRLGVSRNRGLGRCQFSTPKN